MENIQRKTETKSIVLCSLFSALVCIGAFIKVPLPPVPFTMQWFFVAMAGLILGSKLGFTSVAMYIFIGLAGLPVFTKGGGIGYVFQPTFGYIISEKREKNFLNFFVSNLIGLSLVYLIGFIYLYFIMTNVLGKDVELFKLLKSAVIIFIPTDILSVILSAKVASRIYKVIR